MTATDDTLRLVADVYRTAWYWSNKPTAVVAETVGWSWFFAVSALVAIPGMVLLVLFLLSGRLAERPAERAAGVG